MGGLALWRFACVGNESWLSPPAEAYGAGEEAEVMLTLTHSVWASPPLFKGLINTSFEVRVTGPLEDQDAIRGGLLSASSSLSMYKRLGFFERGRREVEREAKMAALKGRHSIYSLPDSSAMQGMVSRQKDRKKKARSAGGPQDLPVYITVLRDMRKLQLQPHKKSFAAPGTTPGTPPGPRTSGPGARPGRALLAALGGEHRGPRGAVRRRPSPRGSSG